MFMTIIKHSAMKTMILSITGYSRRMNTAYLGHYGGIIREINNKF